VNQHATSAQSFQNKFPQLFAALFCFLFLHSGLPALATTNEEEQETREASFEKKFIDMNIAISEWLDGAAEVIDIFLVGKKVTNRENETNLRIENTTMSIEGEDVDNTTSLGVNLRLPNVEDYFALKFTTYDESQEKRGAQKGILRRTPRERNYGATVGLFRQLGNIKASFQPRIELQDPLRISHSLAFESLVDRKTYSINPKFELFAIPDRGTGTFVALNWFIPLTEIFSFTLINNFEYEEKSHNLDVTNGFSFGQAVTERSSLSYGLLFFSVNRPDYRLDGYSFSITWSHLLYKRIFDYQIIPHVDFLAMKNYRAVAGLNLNLSLNF
jgi:hypothetical protein